MTRVDEPGTPEKLSASQIIENVLGDLEPEGSDIAIAPPKADEKVGRNEAMAEEACGRMPRGGCAREGCTRGACRGRGYLQSTPVHNSNNDR